jgi:hypothetical protein
MTLTTTVSTSTPSVNPATEIRVMKEANWRRRVRT